MCGIVGYIGHRESSPFLLEGLRRLEYRGYDSAGIAVLGQNGLKICKTAGRIQGLVDKLIDTPLAGTVGIGHTRWATHGQATEVNAHPHHDGGSRIAVVHNGVIENYQSIKTTLEGKGRRFYSATDSEVLAQLIGYELESVEPSADDPYRHLVTAVKAALDQVRGTYGLAVVFRDYPDVLIAARLGSPLVVGIGTGENFLASDASPLVGHTDRIVYLADHQIAVVTADRLDVSHREAGQVHWNAEAMPINAADSGLSGFDHYMLQEIYEQPTSLENAMRGRLSEEHATAVFGGLNLTPRQMRGVNRLVLTACGTSWHAALVGEYLIEELAGIPVEVEYASELRYRNPPLDPETLLFAITQSGETADTLAALREMKRKGHHTLAICNVVGSSIAQEADGGIYLHAGPEVGVASTKAYTSQCVVLAMLALYFGRLRHMSFDAGLRIIESLQALPAQLEKTLEVNDRVKKVAERYAHCNNFLYMGRQFNFPTALEGALKLKEISYIHAEGYPAAEMKHGPIALVDEHTPSVFIMPHGKVYDKVMANLEEVKARGGPVIVVACEGDTDAARLADEVIYTPHVEEFLQPIISVAPLQLLAYHIAVLRGCDVDKPRNLAKSVTVE
ncbi:glutamine--fructose-6-phosphate transaminase (isomerizing) [Lignipirellula cremea]|uniref:Glutamine--fructose-6-phosphate aminotransferase [isomerizing] n=1 Tax=Lignipirellula cremea TaxID=2528010 RepID=A0A518DUW7_9BACT|nr:glutamine--fructose-6-phosphate transaminase (isomerizing) [Lignipirellula cremea]QDU95630.1 Glutamine--fructose-6-phosphate aminotransferase [isomerizing] [Lignipirellula cremea]